VANCATGVSCVTSVSGAKNLDVVNKLRPVTGDKPEVVLEEVEENSKSRAVWRVD
jgi:hypothetical protein